MRVEFDVNDFYRTVGKEREDFLKQDHHDFDTSRNHCGSNSECADADGE